MMSEEAARLFGGLCSAMKLDRDRAAESLEKLLPSLSAAESDALLADAGRTLDELDAVWHVHLGCLNCISLILDVRQMKLPDDVLSHLIQLTHSYLSHQEARVRAATGELLGRLCGLHGPTVYASVEPTITGLIVNSLQAEDDDQDKWETSSVTSRDSSDVFANTASWTVLETCLRALERLVVAGRLTVTQDMLDLVLPALKHRNRFVREAGFGCIAAFLPPEIPTSEHDVTSAQGTYSFGDQLSTAVAAGMDDNWSQVRMAASVAARRFLCGLPENERERYLPRLLPRICLSRYYVAEGVKIYNQRTWEMIAGHRGRDLVQKYINDVVEYYLTASAAENHAVREAACYCVSELTRKLPPAPLEPHATRIMDALLVCFRDDSWPVRDTACLAVGRLLTAFPAACRPYLGQLFPLLMANLHDNIPSVRQGGAEALAGAVRAYGEEVLTTVMDRVRADLAGVKDQPAESERYSELDGNATYGVVKRQRDNDMDLHTDKPMYSCGSLAPKMAAGGCSASHHFRRPTQPWEAADGSVRLLAELSAVAACSATVAATLPLMAAAASHRHYTHHVHLIETVCRALPPTAAGIGKRPFKQHLESFLDILLYGLTCENQLTAEAARWCAEQLSQFLGPGIFRGRVENFNPNYVSTLDRFLPPPRP